MPTAGTILSSFCTYSGCTDPTAINYNPFANTNTLCQYDMTYVPDDNFEQFLISNGYDNFLDDSVKTINIQNSNLTTLYLANLSISDLTGIEDFTFTGVKCQ